MAQRATPPRATTRCSTNVRFCRWSAGRGEIASPILLVTRYDRFAYEEQRVSDSVEGNFECSDYWNGGHHARVTFPIPQHPFLARRTSQHNPWNPGNGHR